MWVEIELRASSTGSKPVDCLSIFSPHSADLTIVSSRVIYLKFKGIFMNKISWLLASLMGFSLMLGACSSGTGGTGGTGSDGTGSGTGGSGTGSPSSGGGMSSPGTSGKTSPTTSPSTKPK
jgi:hypothetical protein